MYQQTNEKKETIAILQPVRIWKSNRLEARVLAVGMNTGSEHPAERLLSPVLHSKSTIKSMLDIGCSATRLHDSWLLFLFLFIFFLCKVLKLFWEKALWIGNINSLITVCFAFLASRKQLFSLKKKSEIILKLKQAALFWSLCWFPKWFWNANRNFKHHEIWVLSQTLLSKLLSLNCLNSEVHRKWASWRCQVKWQK